MTGSTILAGHSSTSVRMVRSLTDPPDEEEEVVAAAAEEEEEDEEEMMMMITMEYLT